jgi:hypothetical protein
MFAAPEVSPPVEQRGKQAPWKNSLTTAPNVIGSPWPPHSGSATAPIQPASA